MKLGAHLKKTAFKAFKAKNLHEAQNAVLSLSQHQLSVIDEIVNKASEGKSLDLLHYPNVDISHLQETAKAYKGHTENHVKFARRARELKAGGLGSLFKSSLDVGVAGAKKVGKAALSGAKKLGKMALQGAKKGAIAAGKWAIANPGDALQIASGAYGVVSQLLEDETEPEVQHTQQQQNLLDDLLDESDLEDEKEERGGSLEPRRQADHRWII